MSEAPNQHTSSEALPPRSVVDTDADAVDTIPITVSLGAKSTTFNLTAAGTLDDLTLACEDFFDTPDDSPSFNWSTHKFIAPPPTGLIKAGENGTSPLAPMAGKKLRLLAAKLSEIDSLRTAEQYAARRRERRSRVVPSAARPHRTTARRPGDDIYTFLSIRPLPYLPRPERSQALLERVANDRGIRESMRRRKFTVGLLTEMDPAAHTDMSHDGGVGRTLGLNRNKGEVIELRLRTDAGDGYRDYKTIRKTLCHELAHNVHGPHDRNFWDLCHAIEREVEAEDWISKGGRTVGDGPGFDETADDEDYAPDHGGWTGGEFVLGGASGASGAGPAGAAQVSLSRREILAKAAEERMRRMNQEGRDGENGVFSTMRLKKGYATHEVVG
ncbi:hypothetical protein PoMZ_09495 [Pyricularia oryzae]|uniref:WLM domain-containing protein n=1 Tax=Pyricularia oryzae TaxID=318829 RepID=A0A4V1C4R5_PYROR|nr:hypothetical protein PoMZ_09495 [Pyricularia oryzae]